jgi:hypothetical protein
MEKKVTSQLAHRAGTGGGRSGATVMGTGWWRTGGTERRAAALSRRRHRSRLLNTRGAKCRGPPPLAAAYDPTAPERRTGYCDRSRVVRPLAAFSRLR